MYEQLNQIENCTSVDEFDVLIHETLAYDRPETTESDNDEGGVQERKERKERNTKEGDVSTGTFKNYFLILLYSLYECSLYNYKLFNTKKKRQLIIFYHNTRPS